MQPQRRDVCGGDHVVDREEHAVEVVLADVALQHGHVWLVGLIERETRGQITAKHGVQGLRPLDRRFVGREQDVDGRQAGHG